MLTKYRITSEWTSQDKPSAERFRLRFKWLGILAVVATGVALWAHVRDLHSLAEFASIALGMTLGLTFRNFDVWRGLTGRSAHDQRRIVNEARDILTVVALRNGDAVIEDGTLLTLSQYTMPEVSDE